MPALERREESSPLSILRADGANIGPTDVCITFVRVQMRAISTHDNTASYVKGSSFDKKDWRFPLADLESHSHVPVAHCAARGAGESLSIIAYIPQCMDLNRIVCIVLQSFCHFGMHAHY